MTQGLSRDLSAAWMLAQQASLHATWVKANPREAAALTVFWEDGGSVPTLRTAYGRAWVQVAKVRWGM